MLYMGHHNMWKATVWSVEVRVAGARYFGETGREERLDRKINWTDKLMLASKMPGVPCYKTVSWSLEQWELTEKATDGIISKDSTGWGCKNGSD